MILVTGVSGMLGACLVADLLKAGNKIRVVLRNRKSWFKFNNNLEFYLNNCSDYNDKIEIYYADLQNVFELADAFIDISKVYHCAAIVSFSKKDEVTMIEHNIAITSNIVNLCLETNIKLCHVSSIAALGHCQKGSYIDESNSWNPAEKHSAYSKSKFHSELEVWRGIEEGLNAVIVNPSVIIGAGDWNSGSPSIIYNVWKGMRFYTTGITGFVSVSDVSVAMIKLMESEISGERFIISAQNMTYKELFSKIAIGLSKTPPKYQANKTMLKTAYVFDQILCTIVKKKPVLTKDIIRSATEISEYDNTKLINRLDFSYTTMDKTIRKYCDVFLNDIHGKNTFKVG